MSLIEAVLVPSPEVREAVAGEAAVVALETSVLAQGLPRPRNVEAMEAVDAAVRGAGAVPAWVFVEGGAVRVGGHRDDVVRMATGGGTAKVARRDLPMAVAGGGAGATTVSAMLWGAGAAGIEVAATGGIGGVHPGTRDVSADLLEMARTALTLVCSGPKSIVDPVETAERLEELGIGVLGYRCDRLPFFLAREAAVPLEHRVETPGGVAAIAAVRMALGVGSALLVCNPVPAEFALAPDAVAAGVRECQERAEREGITGKALTPFLLSCLAEHTAGASLEANLALLEGNAALAGEVAVSLAGMDRRPRADPADAPSG